ncbi:C40 family peptidase [Neisseria perflava]|uniref:C40 family peptidase n=1 Tax=Neisseria perflava TaxID=33053 RepID=UPI0020A086AE|nr:C40 family peptidase [Neisseria perflava]MCP1660426.1 cell wall-associated NlpC family hydrolase [Neisseria perflava]
MNTLFKAAVLGIIAVGLASCGTASKKSSGKRSHTVRKVQPVRITHIDHEQGSQELMLHSMSLIGTPYKWGGSSTEAGFDCSGMIQYVYKNALGVNLPRTARDMAAASRKIPDRKLKAGDLVFFHTGGRHKYSHVGLYIGNGEFIHAPSSGKTVQTEKLSKPYYAKHYLGAHTFFAN